MWVIDLSQLSTESIFTTCTEGILNIVLGKKINKKSNA